MHRVSSPVHRLLSLLLLFALQGSADESPQDASLSDEARPLTATPQMKRPAPLLDIGNPYLAPGVINKGFTLPGGAVWNPSFMVYGSLQTAVQRFDDGDTTRSEWANRLDVYANLQLSGTERLLVGFRPLDKNGGFTGYAFEGEPTGWQDDWSATPQTLFFEGDFSQLFPRLQRDKGPVADWGFSVGRQPLLIQDGLLINDDVDLFGLVRNTRLPRSGANLRHTVVAAWNEIHRADHREDGSLLFGSFNAYDGPVRTLEADVVVVDDPDHQSSGVFAGLAAIQRLNRVNFSLRALASQALDEESDAVGDGTLLFTEVSTTPPGTENLLYANGFWGLDHFTSAARGPDRGGPLGRTGILYEAVGLGRYGAPLDVPAANRVGFALGYQMFSHNKRRQLIVELGGDIDTASDSEDQAVAFGGRFQQAIGQRTVLRFDAFCTNHETAGFGQGGRMQVRWEF